jgi:succinoglycan biosynthesis protein ExoM
MNSKTVGFCGKGDANVPVSGEFGQAAATVGAWAEHAGWWDGQVIQISIVICTFDRPEGLRRALRSCLAQDNPTNLAYEVVVVDNTPTANARDLVRTSSRERPHLVRYLSDPRTNIAHARNTGVAAARGHYIAFMDDDMAAPPGWLTAAFASMQRTGADVLLGRIVPEFEDGPGWGGSLQDPVRWFGRDLALPDGAVIPPKRDGHIPHAGTGNCVLRRATTLEGPAPFDPAFGQIGGEDTDFLQRLGQRGAVSVFSTRAWMIEFVPAHRNTPEYLARRNFQTSQKFVRIAAQNSARKRLTACRHMATGLVQLATATVRYGAAKALGADPVWARLAAAAAAGKLRWRRCDADAPYR